MRKLADILKTFFSVGVLICLFAGALSLIGYLFALFIGGEAATSLCAWIYKIYLPWVVRITSIIALIGLIEMYLTKQKALTLSTEKVKEKNA